MMDSIIQWIQQTINIFVCISIGTITMNSNTKVFWTYLWVQLYNGIIKKNTFGASPWVKTHPDTFFLWGFILIVIETSCWYLKLLTASQWIVSADTLWWFVLLLLFTRFNVFRRINTIGCVIIHIPVFLSSNLLHFFTFTIDIDFNHNVPSISLTINTTHLSPSSLLYKHNKFTKWQIVIEVFLNLFHPVKFGRKNMRRVLDG